MSNITQRWCINCEEWVAVEQSIEGHSVVQFVPDMGESEIFWCEGEFTDSPPPDNFDPDFDLRDEPSQKELELMDVCAKYLMEEF